MSGDITGLILESPEKQFAFYERTLPPIDYAKCERCGGTGYWRWECKPGCEDASWPHLHYEPCEVCVEARE